MPFSLTREAFLTAVRNDPKGLVSQRDAERVVSSALSEINRSDKPEQTFADTGRYVSASLSLLGKDQDARTVLTGFSNVGASAVNARLEALTGQAQLPQIVERAFASLIDDEDIAATGPTKLSNVNGNVATGFSFDYDVGGTTGKAFAKKFDGNWILSPIALRKEDVDNATSAMRAYFDEHWAPQLAEDWGASASEIAGMRASIEPEGFIWPNNSDPIGISDTYPVALRFHNPTGSDHGFYAGTDPTTGDSEAGDFN